MSRDPRVYLEDVLESIRRINAYVTGLDEDRFACVHVKCTAVVLKTHRATHDNRHLVEIGLLERLAPARRRHAEADRRAARLPHCAVPHR